MVWCAVGERAKFVQPQNSMAINNLRSFINFFFVCLPFAFSLNKIENPYEDTELMQMDYIGVITAGSTESKKKKYTINTTHGHNQQPNRNKLNATNRNGK